MKEKIIKTTISYLIITGIILFSFSFSHAGPFQDVKAGHWSYEAIRELSAKGVLEGYPNNKFMANKSMTRYEVAQFVARLIEVGGLGGDYSTLQKLIIEFADELALLGVNIKDIKDLDELLLEKEKKKDEEYLKKHGHSRKKHRINHLGTEFIEIQENSGRYYSKKNNEFRFFRFETNEISVKNKVDKKNKSNSMRFKLNKYDVLNNKNIAPYWSSSDGNNYQKETYEVKINNLSEITSEIEIK